MRPVFQEHKPFAKRAFCQGQVSFVSGRGRCVKKNFRWFFFEEGAEPPKSSTLENWENPTPRRSPPCRKAARGCETVRKMQLTWPADEAAGPAGLGRSGSLRLRAA